MSGRSIILTKEQQKKLISEMASKNVKTSNICDTLGIQSSRISNLNAGMMNKAQEKGFYDPNSQKTIQCIFNSMLKEEGVGSTSRFYHLMNKMGKLGSGAYGDVMFGGKGNLSRRGNFQLSFDPDGLFVAKLSKTDNEEIEREYFMGELLNQLRDYIPNFAQVYGVLIGCDDITTDKAFCSSGGSRRVLIMEKVKGVDLNKWLQDAPDTDEYTQHFYAIVLQIFLAIMVANQEYQFSHHDLHPGNVMVRELDEEMYIPYVIGDKVYFVKSKFIATMIDFGMSRAEFFIPSDFLRTMGLPYDDQAENTSIIAGTRNFDQKSSETVEQYEKLFQSGISPVDGNPLYDFFRFLHVIPLIRVMGKVKLYRVIQDIIRCFPYEIQITLFEENENQNRARSVPIDRGVIETWQEKFFSLSIEQIKSAERIGFTPSHFIELFYQRVRSTIQSFPVEFRQRNPMGLACISSNEHFKMDFQPQVPLLDCSDKLASVLTSIPELQPYLGGFNKVNCQTIGQAKMEFGVSDGESVPEMDDLVVILDFLQQNPQYTEEFRVGRYREKFNQAYKNAMEFVQKGARYREIIKSLKSKPIYDDFPIEKLENIYTWIFPTQRYVLAVQEFVQMGLLKEAGNVQGHLESLVQDMALILVLVKNAFDRVSDEPQKDEPKSERKKRNIRYRAELLMRNIHPYTAHPENPRDLNDKAKTKLGNNIRRRPRN